MIYSERNEDAQYFFYEIDKLTIGVFAFIEILQEKMAGEWSGEATRMNERKVTQRNNCKSSCEFLRLDNEEIEKVDVTIDSHIWPLIAAFK